MKVSLRMQNAEQDREEHKDIAKEENYEENKEDKVLIKNVLKCIKKKDNVNNLSITSFKISENSMNL